MGEYLQEQYRNSIQELNDVERKWRKKRKTLTLRKENKMKSLEIGIYAIKDLDMGFTDVIAYPNRMIALREFGDIVNSGKSKVSMHPEKFELWELGIVDDQTGEFTGTATYLEKAVNLLKLAKDSNL